MTKIKTGDWARSCNARSGREKETFSRRTVKRIPLKVRHSQAIKACCDMYRVLTNAYCPDEFPGHYDSIQQSHQAIDPTTDFYVPDDPKLPHHTRIDKSNLLLIGPTGVGKTYILEYVLCPWCSFPSLLY